MGVLSTVNKAWPVPNKKIGAIVKSDPVTPSTVSGKIRKIECTVRIMNRDSKYRLSYEEDPNF
jgi:hypothetical protein